MVQLNNQLLLNTKMQANLIKRQQGAVFGALAAQARFEQSLDKNRPLLLLTPYELSKKAFDLVYEYTDTSEKVRVPNIWYNQTVQMRIEHWQWEIKYRTERLESFKAELKLLELSAGKASQKSVKELLYTIEQNTEALQKCKDALEDVKKGVRFV